MIPDTNDNFFPNISVYKLVYLYHTQSHTHIPNTPGLTVGIRKT